MNGNHPSGPYPPTSPEHKGAFLPRSNRLQLLLTFFKAAAERFWQQTSRQFCHQAGSANIWHGRAISLIHCIPQNGNKSYVKYRSTIAGSLNCRKWQKSHIKILSSSHCTKWQRNHRFIGSHKMSKNVKHQNIIGSLDCKIISWSTQGGCCCLCLKAGTHLLNQERRHGDHSLESFFFLKSLLMLNI